MAHVYGIYAILYHVCDMFGPYLASITSRQARGLEFSRLSQHGLRYISSEGLLFGIMYVSCFGLFQTKFGLPVLQDQLEH